MLEHYIRKAERREALRRNHLGWVIEAAAARFHHDGHSLRYARHSLLIMSRFGDWVAANGISVEEVGATHTDAFLAQYVPPTRPEAEPGARSKGLEGTAVRLALRLIHERYPRPETPTPVQAEVAAYVVHLRRDRGLAPGSIEHHEGGLQAFLEDCFGDGPVDVAVLTAEHIHAHLHALPQTLSNGRRRRFCSTLRGYLRFAELQGAAVPGLISAVPVVPAARPAVSPTTVPPKEMAQLLASVDRSTCVGKRTYAVIRCLADLGIRVGDVARLSLDDIDWRAGTVRVANHKERRPYWLPLPERLGQALAGYLQHGRPVSACRALFMQRAKPEWLPATVDALKSSVRRAWELAGLAKRFNGTHILRHTAATRMKQQGVPLKSIADVLGHGSLQMTALYAQVDLPVLRRVAQRWPGGAA